MHLHNIYTHAFSYTFKTLHKISINHKNATFVVLDYRLFQTNMFLYDQFLCCFNTCLIVAYK